MQNIQQIIIIFLYLKLLSDSGSLVVVVMVDNVVPKVEELLNVKIFFVVADCGMVGCCVDVKTSAVVNEKLFNCKLVGEG